MLGRLRVNRRVRWSVGRGPELAELVAEAAHRQDRRGFVAERLELGAQASNVHVHGPTLAEGVVPPEHAGQLVATEHALWLARQRREQPVLGGRQVDRLAGYRHRSAARIDRERPDL